MHLLFSMVYSLLSINIWYRGLLISIIFVKSLIFYLWILRRCHPCKILLIKRISKLTIIITIWTYLLCIFWNMKFLSWITSNSRSWKRFVIGKIILHFFILFNHIHYGVCILSIIIKILFVDIWASFYHLVFLSYSWLTYRVIRFIFHENWF